MDIKRLGVSIDPSGAQAGARKVEQSLQQIGNTAEKQLGRVDRAANDAIREMDRLAAAFKRGMDTSVSATRNLISEVTRLRGIIKGLGLDFRGFQGSQNVFDSLRVQVASLRGVITQLSAQTNATAIGSKKLGESFERGMAESISASKRLLTEIENLKTGVKGLESQFAGLQGIKTSIDALKNQIEILINVVGRNSIGIARNNVALNESTSATNAAAIQTSKLTHATNAAAISTMKFTAAVDRSATAQKKSTDQTSFFTRQSGMMHAAMIAGAAGAHQLAGAFGFLAIMSGTAMASLAPLIAVLLPLIAAIKTIQALIGSSIKGVKLAGEVQRMQVAFTALTGSSSEARRIIEELRKTARDTGVALADQAQTVQKFIALGFKPDDAIKLQRNIIDVAGAVGLTTTEAKLLGNALAQVQAKGVVSMEELRQQIAEKGIPVIQELQRKTGLFGQEFFKAVAKGQIPAKELIDIFLNMEGSFEKFQGGAKKIAQTIPGQFARIKESSDQLFEKFGEPIADAIGPILNDIINILQTGGKFAEEIGKEIGNFVRILYGAIKDNQLEELFANTLGAGFEIGLNFLANGFIKVIGDAGALMVSAFEFAGKSLMNALKTAFSSSVNFFAGLMESVLKGLAFEVDKLVKLANKIPKVNIAAPTFGGIKFGRATPDLDERTFQEMLEENKRSSGFAAGELTDPFGTTFRDALDRQTFELLDKSLKANSPGGFTFDKEEEEKNLPLGVGQSGTNKQNEDLERQLSIIETLQRRLGELSSEWGNIGLIVADLAEGAIVTLSGEMTNALSNIALGAESVGDAFRNMANAVIQSIIQMIIEATIRLAIANALSGPFGLPAGKALEALGGTVAGATAPIKTSHSGTGNGGRVRSHRVGLAKYHNGGILSSENLSVTDDNETVLTRRRSDEIERQLYDAKRGEGRKAGKEMPLQIVNVLDSSEVLEIVAANPEVTVNAISRQRRQVEAVLGKR